MYSIIFSRCRGTLKLKLITFGPSLIRIAGIPSLSIEVVFHQLGAPSSEIFSSTLSFATISGIDASRNERDMVKEPSSKNYGEPPVRSFIHPIGDSSGSRTGTCWSTRTNIEDISPPHYHVRCSYECCASKDIRNLDSSDHQVFWIPYRAQSCAPQYESRNFYSRPTQRYCPPRYNNLLDSQTGIYIEPSLIS